MRGKCVFAVAFVAALPLASSATADPPTKVPNFQTDTVLSGVCAFDVGLHFTKQHQHARVFSNGVVAGEGQLFAELTNLSNGHTLDVNVSGPGAFIPQADGNLLVRLQGHTLIFFFPGQLGPGTPGQLLLTQGLTTEMVGPNGPVPGSFTTTGSVTDACAALS